VQGALDHDGARRVLGEHLDVTLGGRAGGGDAQGARVVAQVVRVLHDVEAKRLARERAVREPG
jgi:hypothetical protein